MKNLRNLIEEMQDDMPRIAIARKHDREAKRGGIKVRARRNRPGVPDDWLVKLPDQEDLGDGGFRAGRKHLAEESHEVTFRSHRGE